MARLVYSDEHGKDLMVGGESRTAAELEKYLPDDWVVYCNKIIPLESGITRELDFIVVASGCVMLLEDKSWRGRITGTQEWWILDTGESRRSPLNKLDFNTRKLLGYLTERVPELSSLVPPVYWLYGYVILSHTNATMPGIDDIRKEDQILLSRDRQAITELLNVNKNAWRQQVSDNHDRIVEVLSALPDRTGPPREIRDFIDIEPLDSPPYPEIERYRGRHRDGPLRDLTVYDLQSQHQRGREFYLREYRTLDALSGTGLTPAVDLPFNWSDDRYLVVPTALPDSASTSYGGLRKPDSIEDIHEELERNITIFEGLNKIHDLGIIHRSLGLGNIYFQETDTGFTVTFTQFWSARGKEFAGGTVSVELDEVREAIISENPAVAPELFTGYQYAENTSDTYAISLLLLSRLTGINPENLRNQSSMDIEIPRPSEAWMVMGPDLSARLIKFFEATLGPAPSPGTGSGRMGAEECAHSLREIVNTIFGSDPIGESEAELPEEPEDVRPVVQEDIASESDDRSQPESYMKEDIDNGFDEVSIDSPEAPVPSSESDLPEEPEDVRPVVQEDIASESDDRSLPESSIEEDIDTGSDEVSTDSPEVPVPPSESALPPAGVTDIPPETIATSDEGDDGERLLLSYESIKITITDLGISIGRDRDNELMIDEPYVSREHAEAIFEGNRCTLRDAGSANGTVVNGQTITGPVTLHPGDVITVGRTDIHVEATHTSDNHQQEWKLTVLSGPDDGSEFNVIAGTTTIGRSPQSDIVLNSKQVSRNHARFIHTSGGLRIEDRQSTNGTFVNDIRVALQGLEDGDHIRLGDTIMQISIM